jgi:hypothetical protein
MRFGIRNKNADGTVDEVNRLTPFIRFDRDYNTTVDKNKYKIAVRQPTTFSNDVRLVSPGLSDQKYFKFNVDGNCLKLDYIDENDSTKNKLKINEWCNQ